jgi:hypothetical protein
MGLQEPEYRSGQLVGDLQTNNHSNRHNRRHNRRHSRCDSLFINQRRLTWPEANKRSNREKKKPKKEKIKTIAAAPSQKGAAAGWQPNLASGKKK